MFQKYLVVGALGLSCMPMGAMAQIAEVRIGVAEFDERGILASETQSSFRGDENSLSVSGEVLFEEPEFLKWALSPQPYIGGSLNLEGKTSFGGGGLLWRQSVGKNFYGDFAVGLVAHDGTKEISLSDEGLDLRRQIQAFEDFNDVPDALLAALDVEVDERFARESEEIEFGSRVLFRLQGAIGVNVNEDWAGEVYIEHLSNGSVFAKDVNEGVDILGVRAVRKF